MKKIISTDKAPQAVGPYSQAVEVNGALYISGQIPLRPETGEMVQGGIREQTEQVFRNIEAILSEAGYTFENVAKTTVLLNSIDDFVPMNEVYARYFKADMPARSTFQVGKLPKNALVEIETIAVK